ncbi:MAG: Fpg/Nei family DNA glycosylase [Actinomycetota bacterium]|nr:Fpg/Nei family DNA glycosylase [Actinomycetota bacterium]
MPELPEVEALARFLHERAVGRAVSRVEVGSVAVMKTFDPPPESLLGLHLDGAERRGKFLVLHVGGVALVVHLARLGWLQWREELSSARLKLGGPVAFRLGLDGPGFDLTEGGGARGAARGGAAAKKRLAVWVVRSPQEVPGIARLGVDPLDPVFTPEVLARLLAGTRGQVKGLLTDQTVLAGVGNAYSDEALWHAQLSPYKPAANLTPGEVERLYDALVTTLTDAVCRSAGLASSRLKAEKKSGLAVHGRTGEPCPRCGDTIREVAFADKAFQYCATCQTGGKPLADRRLSRLLK